MTGVEEVMETLIAFPDNSRVWIYQADKPIDEAYVPGINARIAEFTRQWVSHNDKLRATGGLFHNRFVVLVVDDAKVGPSGCSIDSSVRFIRALGDSLGTDFFDRMHFAYIEGDTVNSVHKDRLAELYASGQITDDTLVFDNLVNTVEKFSAAWTKRLGDSWMKRFV